MSHSLPSLFADNSVPEQEDAFLTYHEMRIKTIVQQSAIEVGRSLAAVRDRLSYKNEGFETWIQQCLGFNRDKAYQAIRIFERLGNVENFLHLDLAFSAQLELTRAPDPGSAVDEAALRKEIEGELTAKVAREIAQYQRAERIAKDNLKTAQERATAVEFQLNYVKQQLAAAKTKFEEMQTPRTVEKTIEVVPEHVQEHIALLQERQKQLTYERDSYLKQLEEERATGYAHRAMSAEGQHSDRIRSSFAEGARDFIRAANVFLSKLPTRVDTIYFEGDDWQRVVEVRGVAENVAVMLSHMVRPTSAVDIPLIVEAEE